ncbi:PhaM family polyhydroxyalkanoate granule multifunctional regulatory protein [Hydrogenophaga sp.]|uniref:PhaM family polyhydroxyalkanoate granule multifunctional regulatory protein n=1 Tax=Hydrogenophaga sp. TaxID=1904254 RepID=UPI003F6E6A9E
MSDAPSSGFGKFVPGFEFLQNLAGQAAGGVAQGISQNIPQLPNLGHWVAPTFNVEDLEKRIEELKAVHFWLDQNSKALGATIQALEVQKMTLSTLKSMNFSMGDVANALKIKAADTLSSFTGATARAPSQFAGLEVPPRTYGRTEAEAEPEDDEEPPEEAPAPRATPRRKARPAARKSATPAAPAGGVVDPVQWWGALSQQFQQIATNAMKDAAKQSALDTTRQVASGLTGQAMKTATGVAGKVTRNLTDTVARNVGMAAGVGRAAAKAVSGSRATPTRKAAAKKAAPRKSAASRKR